MSATLRRYFHAFAESQAFLNIIGVNRFPLELDNLLDAVNREYGIDILLSSTKDFSKFRQSLGRKTGRVKISDGRCYYIPDNDVYIIFINEKRPRNRRKFTFLHELAHIILGHLSNELTELDRGLDDLAYFYYEGEANTFAGNALVPPILLHEFLQGEPVRATYIQRLFDVSRPASRYRAADYQEWLQLQPSNAEQVLHERCHMQMHAKYCSRCKAVFYAKTANCCSVCGNGAVLRFKGVGFVKYSTIELDQNSKALKCPKCENEVIREGDHCSVCGSYLVNKCTRGEYDNLGGLMGGCQAPLFEESRFCHLCGSGSTFLERGYLKPWENEISDRPKRGALEQDAKINEVDDSDKVVELPW